MTRSFGRLITWGLAAATLISVSASADAASLSPEQRQQLAEIRQELGKAATLTRQKKIDEAEALVVKAEQRVAKIVQDAAVGETDRTVAAIKKQIAARREAIAKTRGVGAPPSERARKAGDAKAKQPPGQVSFVRDVAPILAAQCLACHSENPQAGLRLDTFAGMEQGGGTGPLLVIGQADQSLMMFRLTAEPPHRMPKDAEPLKLPQLDTIALWINQGAQFDGNDKSIALTNLKVQQPAANAAPKKDPPALAVARPSGGETVSFRRDIAPFMANLCVNCHGGKEPKSGFSLETFEKLMQGGQSGAVVIAGNLDKSRLWDLVGRQDPIKMPMGEARITRSDWENLRAWILEGAKFDGADPRAPLRDMVPSADNQRAAGLAKLSAAEFSRMRRARAKALWEKTAPKTSPAKLESDDFVIYGDVAETRLQQVAGWAFEHGRVIKSWLGSPADSTTLFKGGLTILVVRDRFGFNEFHIELQGRPAPNERSAFSHVTAGQEDALVVLQDTGDQSTAAAPALKQSLIAAMTEASLHRSAGSVPDWLAAGTALALAADVDPMSAFSRQLRQQGAQAAAMLANPEDIYTGRGLTPELTPAAAYAIVEYMIHASGKPKFQAFVRAVAAGAEVEKSSGETYGVDLATISRQFAANRTK